MTFLITFTILSAEWEYQYNGQNIVISAQQGDICYILRNNGITALNVKTGEMQNLNSINSDLKGNKFNSMLKLENGSILISSRNGLSIIENNVITSKNPICSDYPDSDARLLYQSYDGTIWTFSSHKVYWYNDNAWNEIDISDSVKINNSTTYPFDIYKLLIRKNEVWAIFNDNSKTSTRFYDRFLNNPYLKIAVLDYEGVVKVLQNDYELPYAQGDVSLIDLGNSVLLKNKENIFSYENDEWKKPVIFSKNMTKPYYLQNLIKDDSGKVWYIASKNNKYFPVSYEPVSGEFTMHLQETSDSCIYNLIQLSDGTIYANSTKYIYNYVGNGWKISSTKNLGLDDYIFFTLHPNIINGKKYIQIISSKNEIRGTLFCIDDKSKILPISYDFPFSIIQKVDINKFGKGALEGENSFYEPYGFEADSGFVKFSPITTETPSVKLAPNGKLYFDAYQMNKQSNDSPYLTTWDGNELEVIDCGFSSKTVVSVSDFTFKGDLMYSIGSFFQSSGVGKYKIDTVSFDVNVDTMSTYLSVYNLKDKNLKRYDNTNSDLPNWHKYVFGSKWHVNTDSIPKCISVDSECNPWILTSYSLIKFTPTGSEIYDIPSKKIYDQMEYDFKNNELICVNSYFDKIYYFKIGKNTWDSLSKSNCNIKGSLLRFKKLSDETIAASDDLGYLYRYKGNGKFEPLNLNIFGKNNLSSPINDFCLGANGKFYLGTDIGLFSNSDFSIINENGNIITDNISIYPNPSSNFIQIKISELHLETIENPVLEICNMLGYCVLKQNVTGTNIRIDISKLVKGMYYTRIGNNICTKFIKM